MTTPPLERPARPLPIASSDPPSNLETATEKYAATSGKLTVAKNSASGIDAKVKERLAQYDEVVASARDVFAERNKQYRDAISRTGVLGAAVELIGVAARLEGLVVAPPDAGESTPQEVVNVVKDVLNYAAIMGIMIMDDNWKPK